MAWSINTCDITCISSFEQAEKHWGEQKPWKNEGDTKRQLAGRRKTHMSLVKSIFDDAFSCVLHRTSVVTYFRNGLVQLRCHDSQSTQNFAWCVKPPGCNPVSFKAHMFWKVKTDSGDKYYRDDVSALLLEPTAAGNWRLMSTPQAMKEWAYDRKKGAEVQKLLKPYKTWYELTSRLVGERPYGSNPYNSRQKIEHLLENPEMLESYPMLYQQIGHPDGFRKQAYEYYGARTKQPVPHNRLPRTLA